MEDFKQYGIIRYKNGEIHEEEDRVIREYPFTIYLNGREFIRLLCTPRSLKYLAAGFLYSEGVIKSKEELLSIEIDEDKGKAHVSTKDGDAYGYVDNKLSGTKTVTTACGRQKTIVYGVVDFLGTERDKIKTPLDVAPSEILGMMNEFSKRSELFLSTGGVHSCALCDRGEILLFEEDIGRHNALDKILGNALLEDICLEDKIIACSGRISSEMVVKIIKSRAPVLVSRSAPMDSAVDLARKFNLTLMGFARGGRINIYSGMEKTVMITKSGNGL